MAGTALNTPLADLLVFAYRVVFSPIGLYLAAASRVSGVRLLEIKTGGIRAAITERSGQVNDMAFSLDGQLLAAAFEDGTAWPWEATTGAAYYSLPLFTNTAATAVAFSADERFFAWSALDDAVKLLDRETRKVHDMSGLHCRGG